jgi:inner membrane transporter RhtA
MATPGVMMAGNPFEPSRPPLSLGGGLLQYADRLPPGLLVLLAILSIQISSAIATFLFADLGPAGTTACSTVFAAVAMTVMVRPRFDGRLIRHGRLLLAFGLAETCLVLPFFISLQYIPLGIASTISFCGPLGLAVISSRRPIDFLWIALAIAGVALMTPVVGGALNVTGLLFASLAAVAWAIFVLLVKRLGSVFSGNEGLTFGMWSASIFLVPLALHEGSLLTIGQHGLGSLSALAGAGLVALLNVILPLSLEFKALQRMSARYYGILMTLEPAIGAMIGLVWLGQGIDLRTSIAICCVTLAALGVTLTESRRS